MGRRNKCLKVSEKPLINGRIMKLPCRAPQRPRPPCNCSIRGRGPAPRRPGDAFVYHRDGDGRVNPGRPPIRNRIEETAPVDHVEPRPDDQDPLPDDGRGGRRCPSRPSRRRRSSRLRPRPWRCRSAASTAPASRHRPSRLHAGAAQADHRRTAGRLARRVLGLGEDAGLGRRLRHADRHLRVPGGPGRGPEHGARRSTTRTG